ncbi:MAG: 3-isopropylmalate dehydratase [Elusimicrobiota bacterium]
MKFEGRVWVLGDDIDTDIIISGKYLRGEDPKVWAEHVFEVLGKDYSKKIKQGDIVIAGENFGCGSSREQAAIAVKESGISAVIAVSVGRIFFRNCINIGLPVVTCSGMKNYNIKDGDNVTLDMIEGKLKVEDNMLEVEKLPDFMMKILAAGGLINYYNSEHSA